MVLSLAGGGGLSAKAIVPAIDPSPQGPGPNRNSSPPEAHPAPSSGPAATSPMEVITPSSSRVLRPHVLGEVLLPHIVGQRKCGSGCL